MTQTVATCCLLQVSVGVMWIHFRGKYTSNPGHGLCSICVHTAQRALPKAEAVTDYSINKMQSETTDFAPPQCRHLANWTKHMRRLCFWPIRSIIWHHPQNRKYCRQRTTEPRPQITCTENVDEIWMCGFWDMRATDRQTNKHTYIISSNIFKQHTVYWQTKNRSQNVTDAMVLSNCVKRTDDQ